MVNGIWRNYNPDSGFTTRSLEGGDSTATLIKVKGVPLEQDSHPGFGPIITSFPFASCNRSLILWFVQCLMLWDFFSSFLERMDLERKVFFLGF